MYVMWHSMSSSTELWCDSHTGLVIRCTTSYLYNKTQVRGLVSLITMLPHCCKQWRWLHNNQFDILAQQKQIVCHLLGKGWLQSSLWMASLGTEFIMLPWSKMKKRWSTQTQICWQTWERLYTEYSLIGTCRPTCLNSAANYPHNWG